MLEYTCLMTPRLITSSIDMIFPLIANCDGIQHTYSLSSYEMLTCVNVSLMLNLSSVNLNRSVVFAVVSTKFLSHRGEFAQGGLALLAPLFLVGEDVLDLEAAVAAGLGVRELVLIEQADEELARDVEQVCGLLGRQLSENVTHVEIFISEDRKLSLNLLVSLRAAALTIMTMSARGLAALQTSLTCRLSAFLSTARFTPDKQTANRDMSERLILIVNSCSRKTASQLLKIEEISEEDLILSSLEMTLDMSDTNKSDVSAARFELAISSFADSRVILTTPSRDV